MNQSSLHLWDNYITVTVLFMYMILRSSRGAMHVNEFGILTIYFSHSSKK